MHIHQNTIAKSINNIKRRLIRIQVLRNSVKLLNLQKQFGCKENYLSFTSTPTHSLPMPPKDKMFKVALSDSQCSLTWAIFCSHFFLFLFFFLGKMGYDFWLGSITWPKKLKFWWPIGGYGQPNCKVGFIVMSHRTWPKSSTLQ